MRLRLPLALVCLLLVSAGPPNPSPRVATVNAAPSMTQPAAAKFTFVIVHGAWGGGWAFRQVDQLLTTDGNKVFRPTLTGLGERVHLSSRDINLDTHIQDIVNVIEFEDLHDIVLVGHSYGGMV